MPSNLRLSAEIANRPESALTGGALAAVMEQAAQDYLRGPAINGRKDLRWDTSDVCPICFTARAKLTRACFCDSKED